MERPRAQARRQQGDMGTSDVIGWSGVQRSRGGRMVQFGVDSHHVSASKHVKVGTGSKARLNQ